jgi:recombination protein RecT
MSTNVPARAGGNNSSSSAPASRTLKPFLEQSHERLTAVLPRYLTPERVVQVVSTLVYRTPSLQKCPPDSVLAAVMQASELGLDLSPGMGEAYLVPYWNKRAGVHECQFQPGYKGLVKLARQSGEIASIRAEIVREGEPFVYRYDPDLTLLHEPHVGSDDPVVLVYAVAKLANGERQAAVLARAEVEAVRARSRSGGEGPWVTDWPEMAKKTAVRRLCKLLPRSLDLGRALEADDQQYAPDGPAEAPPRPPGASRSQALAQRLRGPAQPQLPEPEHDDDADDAQADDDLPRPIGREPGEEG